MFLLFYRSCVERTCRINVLKKSCEKRCCSFPPWNRRVVIILTGRFTLASVGPSSGPRVTPGLLHRCFWAVPPQLALNAGQATWESSPMLVAKCIPGPTLQCRWSVNSLSVKHRTLQPAHMHLCISIFCIRLELACVTKHKQSTTRMFNLWKLSSYSAKKSDKAVASPSNNKSSLSWKLKNCCYLLTVSSWIFTLY